MTQKIYEIKIAEKETVFKKGIYITEVFDQIVPARILEVYEDGFIYGLEGGIPIYQKYHEMRGFILQKKINGIFELLTNEELSRRKNLFLLEKLLSLLNE